MTHATVTPVSFWYLRHGETDWNAEGRSQGNIDIPLNANGLAQARAAGPLLRNRGITTIVASPLSRARVTAEIVAESLGLPIAIDPDLREVGFGVHEGQKMGDWFPDWLAGDFTPEGGESFPTLPGSAARFARAPIRSIEHGSQGTRSTSRPARAISW